MYATNLEEFGHLINPNDFNISRIRPEIFEIFNNFIVIVNFFLLIALIDIFLRTGLIDIFTLSIKTLFRKKLNLKL